MKTTMRLVVALFAMFSLTIAVKGVVLGAVNVEKRSFHTGTVHQDASILNSPGVFSNPFTFFVPGGAGISIVAISSSILFQNITISGIPGAAAALSFVGTGAGTLMQLTDGSGSPFVAPPTQAGEVILTIVFQFAEAEGGALTNGLISVRPIEVTGTSNDTTLFAMASQDKSPHGPNGATLLITLSNLVLPAS